MAEDKKDEKPARKSNPLHDNPRSGAASPEKPEETKEEAAAPATEGQPAAAAAPEEEKPDPYEAGRKMREDLFNAHESERREMHGNHRGEFRKMAKRHEEAIKALHGTEIAQLMQGGAGGGG